MIDKTQNKIAWESTQEKTGIDILGIVSDLQSGRTSPGDTMDKISEHCIVFHESMMNEPNCDLCPIRIQCAEVKEDIVSRCSCDMHPYVWGAMDFCPLEEIMERKFKQAIRGITR